MDRCLPPCRALPHLPRFACPDRPHHRRVPLFPLRGALPDGADSSDCRQQVVYRARERNCEPYSHQGREDRCANRRLQRFRNEPCATRSDCNKSRRRNVNLRISETSGVLRTISAHPWQAIFFTYFCTNIHSYYAKVVLSFSSRSYPQVPIAHNVHTIRVSCLHPIHDHDTPLHWNTSFLTLHLQIIIFLGHVHVYRLSVSRDNHHVLVTCGSPHETVI